MQELTPQALAAVRLDGAEAQRIFEPLRTSSESGVPPKELDLVTEQLRARLFLSLENNDQPTAGLQGLVAFWAETAGAGWLWELARSPQGYGIGSWMTGTSAGLFFDGVDRRESCPNYGLGILGYPQIRTALRRYFFALSEPAFLKQSSDFVRARGETLERV
ncbi:MAG: hypothetical protein V2A73_09495, partial [Pseudomonadota bacterium]